MSEQVGIPSKMMTSYVEKDFLREIALWPNPANSSVNLWFESSVEDMVELSVSNFFGKVVFTDKIKALKGFNTRKLDMPEYGMGAISYSSKRTKKCIRRSSLSCTAIEFGKHTLKQ